MPWFKGNPGQDRFSTSVFEGPKSLRALTPDFLIEVPPPPTNVATPQAPTPDAKPKGMVITVTTDPTTRNTTDGSSDEKREGTKRGKKK